MVSGGVIFTMLIRKGHDFYYANGFGSEILVNFSLMLELVSLIYIFTTHAMGTDVTERVECKQALTKFLLPLPAYV